MFRIIALCFVFALMGCSSDYKMSVIISTGPDICEQAIFTCDGLILAILYENERADIDMSDGDVLTVHWRSAGDSGICAAHRLDTLICEEMALKIN